MIKLAIWFGTIWLALCSAAAAAWMGLSLRPIVQLPTTLWWITTIWGLLVLLILALPGFWALRAGWRARRAAARSRRQNAGSG